MLKTSAKKISEPKTLLGPEQWLESIEMMLLLRRFEERCGQLYGMGKIAGFCHLYTGQEAVVVAANMAKEPGDTMVTAYRDHAHAIVCGVPPGKVLAELMGKAGGCSKGKGGSMHLFNKSGGFYGGHGIVGAQVPIGTGLALSHKYLKDGHMCYTFFGDGAANQGQVFEAFNMAKLWNLPVLYVIENNGYAMGTSVERATASVELFKRGESLGIKGEAVDGMKLDDLYECFCRLSKSVRSTGPAIVEAKTYRFRGHSMSDPGNYRTKAEVESYKQKDPISYAKALVLEHDIVKESDLKLVEERVKAQIKEAIDFAENSPQPSSQELTTDIYCSR